MEVFRVCRARWAASALTGDGARRDGGRWNPRGTAMVYCAETRALTILELLVHTDPATAPDDLVILTIDIPDDVKQLAIAAKDLPTDWTDIPGPSSLQDLGGRWIAGGETAVLRVPSAVLPVESCLLINPLHPESAKIKVTDQTAYAFDNRLLKK